VLPEASLQFITHITRSSY